MTEDVARACEKLADSVATYLTDAQTKRRLGQREADLRALAIHVLKLLRGEA